MDIRKLLVRGGALSCVLGVVALGGWRYTEHRLAERCEAWTVDGRAALADGPALEALDALGRALREPGCGLADDAGVWHDYAEARIRVRAPEFEHVSAAIRALQVARGLAPTDPEIGTSLAEAYLGIGLDDEAVAEAERVLARTAHVPARRALAAGLLAAGRSRELADRLDAEAWTDDGFWFRATRLFLARDVAGPGAGQGAGAVAQLRARILAAEDDPMALAVLRVLAADPAAPGPETLVATLTGAGNPPSADLLGTALLLLEGQQRPDLMLDLLAAHADRLDGALRGRLIALAWQDDRLELIEDALSEHAPRLHEEPELVLYGALAGHGASLEQVRAVPAQDTAAGRAWRALAVAVLDGAAPSAIADASTVVLRDMPGSALALTLAAEAWLELGEFQRAEGLAGRAMRAEPFWAQPRMLRGIVLAQRGAAPVAPGDSAPAPCTPVEGDVESYLRCTRTAYPEASERWQQLMLAASRARAGDDLAAAQTLVDRLRDASPRRATLWRLEQARTLLARETDEESLATAALRLREVLEVLPRHAEGRLLMGLARARLRDEVGGRADVLAAVELEPELWREALRAAVLVHREDRAAGGEGLVELATRIFAVAPLSPEVRLRTEDAWLRGLVASAAGGVDPALERAAYARLVELSPELPFALNNYAWILYESREALPTARALAERAVALDPDEAAYADTLAAVLAWEEETAALAAAERARARTAIDSERARQRASEERLLELRGAASAEQR